MKHLRVNLGFALTSSNIYFYFFRLVITKHRARVQFVCSLVYVVEFFFKIIPFSDVWVPRKNDASPCVKNVQTRSVSLHAAQCCALLRNRSSCLKLFFNVIFVIQRDRMFRQIFGIGFRIVNFEYIRNRFETMDAIMQ